MKEGDENEEDEYGDEEVARQNNEDEDNEEDNDENQDQIEDIECVQKSMNNMVFHDAGHHTIAGDLDMDVKQHDFHIPKPAGPKSAADKYAPLNWNEFFDSKEMIDDLIPCYHAGQSGHVYLCLHGAGHSALSFALLARILKNSPYNCTTVAFDFRGHGDHYRDDETDLSQENLINETIRVIKHCVTRYPDQSIMLVGHSMGGSIACKTMS